MGEGTISSASGFAIGSLVGWAVTPKRLKEESFNLSGFICAKACRWG